MSDERGEFATAIVDELMSFASDLVEPGIASSSGSRRGHTPGGSIGWSAQRVVLRSFATLLPRLIAEITTGSRLSRQVEVRTTSIPRRARASRRPWHFVEHEGALLPAQWVTADPRPAPEPSALGWLLYLNERLAFQLAVTARRLRKHLDEARRSREHEASIYAVRERDLLVAQERDLLADERRLMRSGRFIRDRGVSRVRALSRAPRPYPPGPGWRQLDRLARRIVDPGSGWTEWLSDVPTASLPYLYQRWCGLRVLKELGALGFRPRRDPTAALFLGGIGISLVDDDDVTMELWCEPRITEKRVHASGMRAYRAREQTPDYLMITEGPGGPDAFVLDATTGFDPDLLREKGRYRETLVFDGFRTIAGERTRGRALPERAWAIAPFQTNRCQLADPDGRTGVIPLHPQAQSRALTEWLRDIVAHARAWGRR